MLESHVHQSLLQQFHGHLQPGLAAPARPALEMLGQAAEGGEQRCRVILLLARSRREEQNFGAMKGLGCVLG